MWSRVSIASVCSTPRMRGNTYLSLSNQMPFHQIGSDQGLLSAPVELKRLFIVPAERADLIIDFKEFRGEHIILRDNTVPVMQFRVSNKATKDSSAMPTSLRPIQRTPEASAVKTRMLTLNEYDDDAGETHLDTAECYLLAPTDY